MTEPDNQEPLRPIGDAIGMFGGRTVGVPEWPEFIADPYLLANADQAREIHKLIIDFRQSKLDIARLIPYVIFGITVWLIWKSDENSPILSFLLKFSFDLVTFLSLAKIRRWAHRSKFESSAWMFLAGFAALPAAWLSHGLQRELLIEFIAADFLIIYFQFVFRRFTEESFTKMHSKEKLILLAIVLLAIVLNWYTFRLEDEPFFHMLLFKISFGMLIAFAAPYILSIVSNRNIRAVRLAMAIGTATAVVFAALNSRNIIHEYLVELSVSIVVLLFMEYFFRAWKKTLEAKIHAGQKDAAALEESVGVAQQRQDELFPGGPSGIEFKENDL